MRTGLALLDETLRMTAEAGCVLTDSRAGSLLAEPRRDSILNPAGLRSGLLNVKVMASLPRNKAAIAGLSGVLLIISMIVLCAGPTPARAQAADGFEHAIVTVSFDDGYQSIYDNALPILENLEIKTTQNIITSFPDVDPFFMTSAELLAMYNLGHELGSHSVDHADLTTLTPTELNGELADSKAFLESLTGGTVVDFAYPYGIYNDAVIAAVRQYYLAARCSVFGMNSLTGFNEYLVKAQAVLDTTTPAEVEGWIDDAITNHYWLVLMYHQIDENPGEYHTSPANLATVMQYLHDSGVSVKTMRDAMDEIRPYFRQYNVSASVTGGNGTVSPPSQTLGYLDPASIELNPAPGFSTSSIVDNGVSQPIAYPYVIDQVRLDHSVRVSFAPMKPSITSFSPGFGTPGTSVTIEGSNFQESQGASSASFGGVKATQYRSWSNSKIVAIVPPGAKSGEISISTSGGTANSTTGFQVTDPDWYLAEGSTNWGFETYISIANPNGIPVGVTVTYLPTGGHELSETVMLPAGSQTTLANDHLVSLFGNSDFSTEVRCVQRKSIAVDRTMIWTGPGAASPEAHNSIGATAPALDWYLPEGSSKWGFETWLLVQNPSSKAANVTITYMTETGGSIEVKDVVGAKTRITYSMQDAIGAEDASARIESDVPVVAERSVYRHNRREGACSIGTTTPANNYYLAEGCTGFGFTTYILVQNTQRKTVNVDISYMTGAGPVNYPTFQMAPLTRRTIRVNDTITLPNPNFSTKVHGSAPIIAERAMYWNGGPDSAEACHDSIGIPEAHTSFYLPDGQTSNGKETWTLVQNPNSVPVTVKISYLKQGGGDPMTLTGTIGPNSRMTYSMADRFPNGRAAIEVVSKTAGKKIVVERSIYWNSRGAGTDSIGGFSD